MQPASSSAHSDLRRRILDTARRLLVGEGYTSLSMRKIAKAIGYSPTAIYLHFENKDALFHALIDEGFTRLLNALHEVEAQHLGDPTARIEALCRCYVRFGLEQSEYYEVMFLLHPAHMARYPVEKFRRARRSLDLMVEALEEAEAEGQMEVADAHVAASVLWASLHGAVSLLIAGRLDARIGADRFIDQAVTQALCGLTAPAALVA